MFRLLLGSILFLPPSAFGQENPLGPAIELAQWGEQNYSSEALIVAAQMACGNPHRVITSESFSSLQEAIAIEEPNEETLLPPLHQQWLTEAKKVAHENEELHLLKHLEEMGNCITKGNTFGPAYRRGVLFPGKSTIFSQYFNGGEIAWVLVQGDGLKLHLYDQVGQPLKTVEGSSGQHALSFTPRETGHFWVSVENTSEEKQKYYLVTN